jgi:hypothetical protein
MENWLVAKVGLGRGCIYFESARQVDSTMKVMRTTAGMNPQQQ